MNISNRFKIEYNDYQRHEDNYYASGLNTNNVVFNAKRPGINKQINIIKQNMIRENIIRENMLKHQVLLDKKKEKELELKKEKELELNKEKELEKEKESDLLIEEIYPIPIVNLENDTWEVRSNGSYDSEIEDNINLNKTDVVLQDKIIN
jgi:hypothetical protein